MKSSIFAILMSVLYLFSSITSILANEEQPHFTQTLSENFLSNIKNNQFSGAIEGVRPYWKIEKEHMDKFIQEAQKQMDTIGKQLGKVVSFELVKKETIGKSYIRYSYLYKFEKHAIRWAFTYYQANDQWEVNNINFDTKLEDLFKTE